MESAADARDSGDYGRLQLGVGESFVGPVMNTGSTDRKWLRITTDDYPTGLGSGTIYLRGQDTSFNQDADEVTGPTWEVYTGLKSQTWRYMQVRVDG